LHLASCHLAPCGDTPPAVHPAAARAKNVIAQILPEPQASLLTGILLGDDSGIPKYVQDAFRTTGTSRLIAISG
jgi:predicted membrane metal-binding protein